MRLSIFELREKRILRGFTLVELLVVIAIIMILTAIGAITFTRVQVSARDVRRLADMKELQTALYMYYSERGVYPDNTDNDCSGWDAGYNGGSASGDPFITPLKTGDYMKKIPGDPSATGNCGGYAYYRYDAGSYGCDASRGAFYVLGVRDMEMSGNPHPSSHGWSCPTRNWQTEFDWVTGGFEK